MTKEELDEFAHKFDADPRFASTGRSFVNVLQRQGAMSKGAKVGGLKSGRLERGGMRVRLRQMTRTQRDWFEKMFRDYSCQELICYLELDNGKPVVKSVRHIDFTPIDSYLAAPEGVEFDERHEIMPVLGKWEAVRGYAGEGCYQFHWRFTNTNRENACEMCVDPSYGLRIISAEEVVDYIRKGFTGAVHRGSNSAMNKDDEIIQNELTNTDDKVFIYELLQNANDYPCHGKKVDVEIRLDKDCLCFRHTGRIFSALNVAALCSAGAGDKSDNPNAIGYKGIGFKTVFRNNSKVYLCSGEYSFSFDRNRAKDEIGLESPWRRIPFWEKDKPVDMGEFRVGFKLYPGKIDLLRNDNVVGYAGILKQMFETERVLLFIPEISRVRLQLPGEQEKVISKRSDRWCVSELSPIDLSEDVRNEIERAVVAGDVPPKLKGKSKTKVTFACNIENGRLRPIQDACLYCFLPAEQARWGFRFLMNTDMIPNGHRDNVRQDLKLNHQLSKIAGGEFCKWINLLLRDGRYAYDSIFELIPDLDACIKNAPLPAVKDFIREFKNGFESEIDNLQIPDSTGDVMPISQVWFDEIGVIEGLGHSFWKRLGCVERSVNRTLLGSKDFRTFIGRHREKLGVRSFGWNELKIQCSEPMIQEWLKNPNANSCFVKFLLGSDKLSQFKDVAIYLDNHGELGRCDEMYRYGDGVKNIERWLPKFAHLARYLSPKVTYHEKVSDVNFKRFGPRTFLKECVLSVDTIQDARRELRDVETAKGFWSFIAHYRLYNGRERFADDYKLLGSIPFVTESGEVVDSFDSQEYSVYVHEEHSDTGILQFQWFNTRVRFISQAYFTGDEGTAIKSLFTDSLFTEKKRLVGKVELHDVLANVFDKFKNEILADMRAKKSDMGAFAFLLDCVNNNCVNTKGLQTQIVNWPVEDVDGKLVERVGKHVWYCCDQLSRILSSKWMDGNGLVVLSKKYDAQKTLFNILGAKDFEKVGFGEFFLEEISGHLNKTCNESDIIAFHEYMCEQIAAGRLRSDRQIEALKRTSIIVVTKDGCVRQDGCEDVLIIKDPVDVSLEVAEGRLPESVKVLDSRMALTEEMVRYWESLGCRIFDSRMILAKSIEAYLERQQVADCGEKVNDEFMSQHVGFVLSMVQRGVDPALLNGIKLMDGEGLLASPKDLVLADVYGGSCAFQRYGCSLSYVSGCYFDDAKSEVIREFLCKLGVRDGFCIEDVSFLQEKEFCKYFWTEYIREHIPSDEIVKAMKALPCVLDRACANVRKPSELYSPDLEYPYVESIGGTDEKLPLCDGVNIKIYEALDFRRALTAGDAIEFLLSDADGSKYGFRARALEWIADGMLTSEDIDRYRSDKRAQWRNAKNGQLTHVRDVCAIKSREANRVRSHFGNSEYVIDLHGIDNGDHHIARETIERALEKLRVMLIDNSSLEPIPRGRQEDSDIKEEIKVRLMVLLATSVEASWHEEYVKKVALLESCHFYVCDSFDVICTGFDSLKSERGTFSQKGDEVYYVGGWQRKRVYLDVIRFLKEKLSLSQYTDEDLKDAFDTDGGLRGLAQKILNDYGPLSDDAVFIEQLQKVNNALKLEIDKENRSRQQTGVRNAKKCDDREDLDNEQIVQLASSRGEAVEKECTVVTETEQLAIQVAQKPEENDAGKMDDRRRKLDEKYGSMSDEEYALLKLFDDGMSIDERKDQSKLACIRLVRHLEEQELEPSMYGCREPEVVVRKLYEESTERKGPNIDVNTGKKIHVISAIGGLAYLPPKWWNFLTESFDEKKEVCIMTGARHGDFKFIRHPSDVEDVIAENAVIVKVSGRTAEERIRIISDMFKGDTVTNSPGRVYGVLKMRNVGDGFDWAFMNKILPTIEADESTDSMTNGEY